MAYTTTQIIQIAKISEYLAKINEAKGAMFGKRKAPNTSMALYMERKAVEWMYNLDPINSSFPLTANYLYSLCRGYNLQASQISGSGGSVSPTNPSAAPAPLQFIVDASTSYMINGQSSATITQFIGFNVLFARGGIAQSTLSTEPSYYSWNKTTGLFTVSPAAVTSELFQIYPI